MTEIPDAVIYAMAREIRIVDHPLVSARRALTAALAATDEHGERFYYHRGEVAELLDLQRDVMIANAEARRAEYADALRATRPYVVDGTTAGRVDALLAEHERETP